MSRNTTANPEWPPRSPHDVLRSTPGGRDRLRRMAERTSPSPSPLKRTKSTPSMKIRGLQLSMDDEEEDEDDEETLQLQLQEIQARLKLKKLQKKQKQNSESESESRADVELPSRADSAASVRAQSRIAGIREDRLERERVQSRAEINIPVSPIRRTHVPPNPRSPGRVLLGIDKGLRGADVSLKRAPSARRGQDHDHQDNRAGPYLRRAGSQASSRAGASTPIEPPRQSFSERMAAVRSEEANREERQERIKKSRNMAFDIDHKQMEAFKEKAVALPEGPRETPKFSRDDVLSSMQMPTSNIPRSRTGAHLRSAMRSTSDSTDATAASTERPESRASSSVSARKRAAQLSKMAPADVPDSETSQFEPYSSQHLSKRIIPHQVLTRMLSGKKHFLIPDLLKTVVGPDFNGPDIEEDVVVFAVIASKSEPKSHNPNPNAKNQRRGKFMVMTLTDLKWSLDFFLFGSAFDKFWKLTPGTIIAILNPAFMPPPRGRADTGKFSLTLDLDTDTILEVGTARDLGFCKSVKKDGKTCDSWVDKRHTEFCDYHVNETLKKTHASRMEVNTMTFGKGSFGKGDHGGRKFNSKDISGFRDRAEKKKMEEKTKYDQESHSQIYIGKRTTASLLDDVDYDPDNFHRGSTKAERMNRQLLTQEKERDLAKKLGMMGGGQGAAYMQSRVNRTNASVANSSDSSFAAEADKPPDAAKLGLLGGKALDVDLGPMKRKRERANTVSSSIAMGWGSNMTKELGRMKNGESLLPQEKAMHVQKKTRFVTEKGIREAGRDSIGGEATKAVLTHYARVDDDLDDDDDDDDDDLEITRE